MFVSTPLAPVLQEPAPPPTQSASVLQAPYGGLPAVQGCSRTLVTVKEGAFVPRRLKPSSRTKSMRSVVLRWLATVKSQAR